MNKNIVLIVLAVLCAGAWFYLDYLNKQEQLATEQMRIAMEQARRAQAKAHFEADLKTTLSYCQAAAEKAKTDYLNQNSKPVRGKPGEFTAPQAVIDEAAKRLAAANAECQSTYEDHLAKGR